MLIYYKSPPSISKVCKSLAGFLELSAEDAYPELMGVQPIQGEGTVTSWTGRQYIAMSQCFVPSLSNTSKADNWLHNPKVD